LAIVLRLKHMAHLVDLHAHFLPALDDGAENLETCLSMLRALSEMGFAEVSATPHQYTGMFLPPLGDIRSAFDQVRREVATAMPDLRLHLAAENFWDELFAERRRCNEIPSYDDGKSFLFEINTMTMPPALEASLFDLRVAGRIPVMAHPERYAALQRDFELAEKLSRQAAFVVDLAALSGKGRRAEVKAARRLLEDGLAHAVTSDMHGLDDAPAVAEGVTWIKKRLGERVLTQLLDENPRRILLGQFPEALTP
jgi:protein-tyrosine phosphatase